MKLSRYLADKWPTLAVATVTCAFLALLLHVFGLGITLIAYIEIILVSALIVSFLLDYLRRRRFYTQLQDSLKALDKKHLIAEMIGRPDFHEGELTYDALMAAGKSMNDSIAEYRAASEDYREYIETWVHQIKTPMAAIELILENNPGATDDAVISELSRIESHVEQALYYSRSTAVERDYIVRSVNLDDVVKAAVRRRSRLLIDNHVTPVFEDLDFKVATDAKWLDFIIGQILGNAVKYRRQSVPDEVNAQVMFSATCIDKGLATQRVILEIADNGIGIPSHDLGRVFNRGFTGDNGRTYAKSTGIGLFLCKRLCEKMGLEIWLDSAVGEGTTIKIVFPVNELFLS